MAHFVGKIDFSAFIDVEIAEIDKGNGVVKKCLLIPIEDNGIVQRGGSMEYWFRAFAYRDPKTKFTHFIMKYVPKGVIKKMSARQIENFSTTCIGGMIKDKLGKSNEKDGD